MDYTMDINLEFQVFQVMEVRDGFAKWEDLPSLAVHLNAVSRLGVTK